MMELFLHIGIASFVMMTVLWGYQVQHQDAGIVDVGWSYGIGLSALYLAWAAEGDPTRKLLVACLGTIWSFRLGTYLLQSRILGNRPEDGRYQRTRKSLGERANRVFFIFFQIQASWIVLFAIPFYIAMTNPTQTLHLYDFLGILIWLIAVLGESIADRQLQTFRENPANQGKTCQVGLWKYSRHPNYFFEWVHWFAYIFFSIGSSYVWIACFAPLMMYIFLMKITGIPHTEQQALSNRPDYAEYQKTTNMFFLWFPKPKES